MYGSVERYKARLVAKDFSQRSGAGYDQTYSPVVKYDSLWVILAIAAAEDYLIGRHYRVTLSSVNKRNLSGTT